MLVDVAMVKVAVVKEEMIKVVIVKVAMVKESVALVPRDYEDVIYRAMATTHNIFKHMLQAILQINITAPIFRTLNHESNFDAVR